MNKKRIGFLSYWGFGRGICYTTLCYCKMLKDEYNIYILKQGLNDIAEEFNTVTVNVTNYPAYIVDPEVFKMWITTNKLDAVIFNEYKQWTEESDNLVKVAKDLGVKTYGILVDERFKPEQTRDYDRILVRTRTGEKLMRRNKIRNFTYIPQSIDLKEFVRVAPVKKDKFTFLHIGGFLGEKNRKGTTKVVEAFRKLNRTDCELIITAQKEFKYKDLPEGVTVINENLSRKELIEYINKSDCGVYSSKWETIGIPILESLACGKPVITTDYSPMNEFIKHSKNGFLVSADAKEDNYISVPVMECDVTSLKVNMENILNDFIYSMMVPHCRKTIEDNYDIEKTKKLFLTFLESDLQ